MSFSKARQSITPVANTRKESRENLLGAVPEVSRRGFLGVLGAGCAISVFAPAEAATRLAPAAHLTVDVPEVEMLRHDGQPVRLAKELDDGRAVYLNFIFTSCAAICPASSQLFAQLQRRLGAARPGVHLMSLSIDPENDTPARLREYAAEHGAAEGWDHYTGTTQDSERVQRAFGAWRGDKMNHLPAVWFRAAHGTTWRRLDGFVTPRDLLAQLPAKPVR